MQTKSTVENDGEKWHGESVAPACTVFAGRRFARQFPRAHAMAFWVISLATRGHLLGGA